MKKTFSPLDGRRIYTSTVLKFNLNGDLSIAKTTETYFQTQHQGLIDSNGNIILNSTTENNSADLRFTYGNIIKLDQNLNGIILASNWEFDFFYDPPFKKMAHLQFGPNEELIYTDRNHLHRILQDKVFCTNLQIQQPYSVFPISFTVSSNVINTSNRSHSTTSESFSSSFLISQYHYPSKLCEKVYSPLGCDPAVFTQAPTGLNWGVNPNTPEVFLTWDPYPNATACMVLGRKVGEPNFFPFIVGDVNTADSPSMFSFPASWIEPFTDYEWKVICGCSINPVIASPESAVETFGIYNIQP